MDEWSFSHLAFEALQNILGPHDEKQGVDPFCLINPEKARGDARRMLHFKEVLRILNFQPHNVDVFYRVHHCLAREGGALKVAISLSFCSLYVRPALGVNVSYPHEY
jgi:hypothetical protein